MKRTALATMLAIAMGTCASGILHAQELPLELGDEVSDYRKFMAYPHLQRGLDAMQRGDGPAAIAAFERARTHAPRSVATAVYLAEAYRRFGQPSKAEQLLAQQRGYTPGDPHLPALRTDTRRAAPPRAATAGSEPAASAAASEIRQLHEAAQRAIHDGDSAQAERQFTTLQARGALTSGERRQWFNLRLARGDIAGALEMQASPDLVGASQHLAIAETIAARRNRRELAAYLSRRHPRMVDARAEGSWIDLLGLAAEANPGPLLRYTVRFNGNRARHAQLALPWAVASNDQGLVRRVLSALPPESGLDTRFTVALADGEVDAAGRLASVLVNGRGGDPSRLDSLSFRLAEAGAADQAAALLLASLPFDRQERHATLYSRLASLLVGHPERLDEAARSRLRQVPASSVHRSGHAMVLAAAGHCDDARGLLTEDTASASIEAWARLAQCYGDQQPALAALAYARALEWEPDNLELRLGLAYSAYAAGDFDTALGAWQGAAVERLSGEQLLAAADTAIAAGNHAPAMEWLQAAARRQPVQGDRYWWLLSQAQAGSDPNAALASLHRAIELRPDPVYYASLAQRQQAAGDEVAAVASLERAQQLAPEDPEIQAALAYAYLKVGRNRDAAQYFARLRRAQPRNAQFAEQSAYAHRSAGLLHEARVEVAAAIDLLTGDATEPLEAERRFRLRRLHEQLGRRWAFAADVTLGDTGSAAASNAVPGSAYRSFAQFEAQYRLGGLIGREDHDALAVYARVFAGSGPEGQLWPRRNPTLGAGVRWKPIPERTVYLAIEQQLPLGDSDARNDTLLRISASPLRNPAYDDDWHASGSGWLSHSVFLDLGHYVRSGDSVFTADYQLGAHRKVGASSTIQPFARLQYNGLEQSGGYRSDFRAGLGVRFNHWYGESLHDAFRRRFAVSLEWQQPIDTYLDDSGALMLSAGHRW
ncbi:bacteriophage adsorption protein NfrA [soil metagenome]